MNAIDNFDEEANLDVVDTTEYDESVKKEFTRLALSKKARVTAFNRANPDVSYMDVVNKFKLDIRLLKTRANGIHEFGFFTDITRYDVCCFSLDLPTKKQWDDAPSAHEGFRENWEIINP